MRKTIILFLLSCNTIFGQPYLIKGTVMNISLKKKVENVNVSLFENGKYLSSSETDSLGNFSITVSSKGKFDLKFTCIGFKEFNATTNYKTPLEVFLTPEIYNLEPIFYNKWTENKYKFFIHCDTMSRIDIKPENIPNGRCELIPTYTGKINCWQYYLVKAVRSSIDKQTISNNIDVYFTISHNGDVINIRIIGEITDSEKNLIENKLANNKQWKCGIQNGKTVSATFRQTLNP